jgi:hypothetical protein
VQRAWYQGHQPCIIFLLWTPNYDSRPSQRLLSLQVFDNPLAPDAAQQEKYNSRMSGMDQTLDPKQLKLRT